jgi:chromate transporter
MESPNPPGIRQFVPVIAWIVNATFGGGATILAVFQREFVERRRWLTAQQFGLCFAVGRITPGTSILAFCAALGWHFARVPGALLSLLAGSVPCAAIALAMLLAYEQLKDVHWFAVALRGAMAAAIGIMLAAGWGMLRPYLNTTLRLRTVLLVLASLTLMVAFRLSPLSILGMAALAGFLLPPAAPKEPAA